MAVFGDLLADVVAPFLAPEHVAVFLAVEDEEAAVNGLDSAPVPVLGAGVFVGLLEFEQVGFALFQGDVAHLGEGWDGGAADVDLIFEGEHGDPEDAAIVGFLPDG